MAYRRTTEFEERDYYGGPRSDYRGESSRAPVRTLVRDDPGNSFERTRESDRMPAFLRENAGRTEAGPMVLRERDSETTERYYNRSPSPIRVREERMVRTTRSDSPPPVHEHDHERIKVIERDRVRSPSITRARSSSPKEVRFVERPPPRSPSVGEREHIRIVETERERLPSRSPSPPPVVKQPVIEREVITHYTDVDHGVIQARPPSPERTARRRVHEDQRETDIDISLGKHRTEVDIHEHQRHRSPSRNRYRDHGGRYYDDELVVHKDRDLLVVDDIHRPRRRARSAAPIPYGVDEEADYITSRIDSRGRMGEAWGGATKRWDIIDVPPGTERVRMDGVGGGSTDTTWSKYSGVRRTKFNPERDGAMVPVQRPRSRSRTRQDHRLSVNIDRRVSRPPRPPPQPPTREMWTEITKDLVSRQAIKILGYRYEETKWFYYIMEYLPYDDVLRLIEFSEEIRRARYERARELEWEYDWIRDWDRRHRRVPSGRRRSQSRRRASRGWDEERSRQMEVVVDQRRPAGGHYYY